MSLGLNIKKLRIERNMTQEDLAELLNTTVKSISRWENETTYPDILVLPLLANIFETTVDELLDVEKVKMDEYIIRLNKEAIEYEKNHDVYGELKIWKNAYIKFPNNEEIIVCYITTMNTVNIIENEVVYKEEITKLAERVLEKTHNSNYKARTIQILVDLYTMLNDVSKAEYYAKQLADDYFLTYDVMKTRYLKGNELLKAIQDNTFNFISEITRESEFVIYGNRLNLSAMDKRKYLEKIIKLNEVLFDDFDYGYDVAGHIFNNIELASLIIKTTNEENDILKCFEKVKDGINYIINFKPHYISSPLLNTMECKHIGGYSQVLMDMKTNILKALDAEEFNNYKNMKEYQELIEFVNLLK